MTMVVKASGENHDVPALNSDELITEMVNVYAAKEAAERRIVALWQEFYSREADNRVSIRYLAGQMDSDDRVGRVTFSSWNRRKLRALGMLKPRERN